MEDIDYLDLFQSGVRPRYGSESVLVTSADDLRRRVCVSLLIFLSLFSDFNSLKHSIFLERLSDWSVRGTIL